MDWQLNGKVRKFISLISSLRELKLQTLMARSGRHCLQKICTAPEGLPLIQRVGKFLSSKWLICADTYKLF